MKNVELPQRQTGNRVGGKHSRGRRQRSRYRRELCHRNPCSRFRPTLTYLPARVHSAIHEGEEVFGRFGGVPLVCNSAYDLFTNLTGMQVSPGNGTPQRHFTVTVTPMKTRIRLAYCAMGLLTALSLGGGANGQSKPALAYSEDGTVYFASDSGEILRTVKCSSRMEDFAVSPNAEMIVFNEVGPNEHGGPLYLLTSSREPVRLTPPAREVYSDPEFSPDGDFIVFAIHAQATGDLVESAGPLGIIDIRTHQLTVLSATAAISLATARSIPTNRIGPWTASTYCSASRRVRRKSMQMARFLRT